MNDSWKKQLLKIDFRKIEIFNDNCLFEEMNGTDEEYCSGEQELIFKVSPRIY